MPWDAVTKDRLDQRRARQILDGRYFSLGTARKRLLEYLAVWKLTGRNVPPILCIMGPSGTGRTSLARTVADILGRSFVHIPLGGIQDEGEIRGLARTEVAARPGRILEGIRRAGSRNPVILFENVGGGSTPLPALLEAIDPTLNASFRDRYLGIPFDLSETLFIFTANVEDDVPESLTDFVYAIELSGYTEYVKLDILRDRLWPQALADHGLAGRGIRFTKAAQRRVIREYTREAGVRELKRQLGTICRRLALSASAGVAARVSIDARNLGDFLGKPVYRDDLVGRKPQVGVTTGLAWTEDGGDLLPIEALLMPGDGQIILTGLLGEVMEESVEAALSYVRSRSAELGIPDDIFSDKDLHVHFPEGAIPKDGPSAGITVATTLASLLSGRPVRHDLAMTGEISLRGRILPVGGIREKVLAAYRAKIRHVLLPKDNESDLATVPQEVLGKVRIHLVEQVSDVFRFALRPPETARARR
jgi:ATP-dependent Lon protease